MKGNSVRTLRIAGPAVAAAMLLASCAPRPAPPAPAPLPAPPPPPPPAPQPPPPTDWRDAALSPGDWNFRTEGPVSMAVFGPAGAAAFVMRCEVGRRISLVRVGAGAGRNIIVRTTFGERSLTASGQETQAIATLAASDTLLDQMMFSRGRFLVQVPGLTDLVLPAWPEPARVIEDCRD